MGQQPNGSPTEAVLQDFIARGFSVDDLYLMMKDMGYVEGMRIIQQYGELAEGLNCTLFKGGWQEIVIVIAI